MKKKSYQEQLSEIEFNEGTHLNVSPRGNNSGILYAVLFSPRLNLFIRFPVLNLPKNCLFFCSKTLKRKFEQNRIPPPHYDWGQKDGKNRKGGGLCEHFHVHSCKHIFTLFKNLFHYWANLDQFWHKTSCVD